MGLLSKGYFNARLWHLCLQKTTHNIAMNVYGSINSEFQNFAVFGNCDD